MQSKTVMKLDTDALYKACHVLGKHKFRKINEVLGEPLKVFLRRENWQKGRTTDEIGLIIGVTGPCIQRWMKKLKIPIKNTKKKKKILAWEDIPNSSSNIEMVKSDFDSANVWRDGKLVMKNGKPFRTNGKLWWKEKLIHIKKSDDANRYYL